MLKRYTRQLGTAVGMLGSLLLVLGCGDDDGDVGPQMPLEMAEADGSGQAGTVGGALGDPLVVIVTRDDEPVENLEVEWLTSSGGAFDPEVSVTDEDGAAATQWILGPAEGQQIATARVRGEDAGTVRFTAQAVELPEEPPPGGPPPPTAVR